MFCANCGMKLEDDMLFCPNCGTKVMREETQPDVVQEAPEQEMQPEAAQEAPKEETQPDVVQEAPEQEMQPEAAQEAPKEETQPDVVQEAPKEEMQPEAAQEAPEQETQPETTQEAPKEEMQPEVAQEAPKQEAQPDVVQEAPKQEAQPEATQEAPKKPTAGVAVATFCLCLLAFLAGAGACINGALRLSYAGDKVSSLLKSLDVKEHTISNKNGEEVSIVDFVEEVSGFNFEKTAGISKKEIEDFLEADFMMDTVTDVADEYADYFFTGEKPKAISRDDVVDFVKEHDDEFFRLMKFRFTYIDPVENVRKVYTVDIDNAFKDLGTDKVTVDWLAEQSGINFGLIAMCLSIGTLIGLGVACLLILILVLAVQKKTLASGISADGMTLLILGIVLDVAAGVGLGWLGGRKSSIFYLFLSPLVRNVLVIGSVTLAVGLLIFVTGRLLSGKKKKEKKA